MTTYKITDTEKGIFANIQIEEGTFNLEIKQLPYNKIDGNRRTFEVVGNYPTDKYLITYEAGKLFILKKGGKYEVGQKVTHKAFGKGIIEKVTENSLSINFNGELKNIMKIIAANFLS